MCANIPLVRDLTIAMRKKIAAITYNGDRCSRGIHPLYIDCNQ